MWYIWVLWVFSILLATVFMAAYVRKFRKPEGIIAVYVIYLALSQILAIKLVKFNLNFLGVQVAPAAVLLYPFTYQVTDTVNEHFGMRQTLKMVIIAFVTQVLMVIFIFFGNKLQPSEVWFINNENWIRNNEDWVRIFSQSFSITAASWLSFLITGYLDTLLFHVVKKLTHGNYLWIRSVLSDVPMLFLDSLLFVGLGFGLFQGYSWIDVWGIMLGQIITKWLFGIIDTPFIYLDRWIVNSPKLKPLFQETSHNDRVVLILSGGVDSTTLLYQLRSQNKDIYALSFDYGQKHKKELNMAKKTCKTLGIKHTIVDLSGLADAQIFGNNALTSSLEVPEGQYEESSMKSTVVPNRNMVMLSIAISNAISKQASEVYYGAHAGDHAIYPDCRPEFYEAMDQVAQICDYEGIRIRAPFLLKSKSEIIRIGKKLEVDYKKTWTCYKGQEKACGKCGSCVERLEAFKMNSMEDPLDYQIMDADS